MSAPRPLVVTGQRHGPGSHNDREHRDNASANRYARCSLPKDDLAIALAVEVRADSWVQAISRELAPEQKSLPIPDFPQSRHSRLRRHR